MGVTLEYIGVGRRFIAILIDTVIGLIWTVPLGELEISSGTLNYHLSGWSFYLNAALWIAYFTILEGAFGATAGKFVVGIRVRNPDGSPAGYWKAFVRSLMRVVDAAPWIIPYLVGAIAVWNSPSKQRLGDRVAQTVVVQKGSEGSGADTALPPAG
ncbi:MAG: RDD family protein [Actinomycetota bacterium]